MQPCLITNVYPDSRCASGKRYCLSNNPTHRAAGIFEQIFLTTGTGRWCSLRFLRYMIILSNILPFFLPVCKCSLWWYMNILVCFTVDYQESPLAKVSGREWVPQQLMAITNEPKRQSASPGRRKQILSYLVWLSKSVYIAELLGNNCRYNSIFSSFPWAGQDCFLSNTMSEITSSEDIY